MWFVILSHGSRFPVFSQTNHECTRLRAHWFSRSRDVLKNSAKTHYPRQRLWTELQRWFCSPTSPIFFFPLFLTETQISPLSVFKLHIPLFFFPKTGACASVHYSPPSCRIPNLEFFNREFQFMWLKHRSPLFSQYFWVVYRSPNSADSSIFDLLSSSTQRLLILDFRIHITVLMDFILHNRK